MTSLSKIASLCPSHSSHIPNPKLVDTTLSSPIIVSAILTSQKSHFYPINFFSDLKPQNQAIGVFQLDGIFWSSNFEAAKNWEMLSQVLTKTTSYYEDCIRKSWILGRLVQAFLTWTCSACPGLKSQRQQLTEKGRKKKINMFLSTLAVTNINMYMTALFNLVSLWATTV